ncbi:hypothetical protein CMI40_02470 [Candidatus Pacearchaeota archaeon]|nr:hypothetical protein [Candidatus Pacearchaeota archaeon]|tara:strand:- start:6025 stop:6741 length:717 start_codon:yes stop_codon:yes gene_type:complete
MNTKKIKLQIKKLAKEFDLKYNPKWFNYMWISKREEILTEYIGDCPDPIYIKYGRTINERIKNIDKFVNSKDFKKCIKRYGGQVTHKKNWKKEEKLFKKIKNIELRIELLRLHDKIKQRFEKIDCLALMTKTKIKKEYDWLMKYCLRHEWIHILLNKNKIHFQDINKKYWPYDEGLNEYLAMFLEKKLHRLEEFRKKEKYPMEHKNWVYAIKFRSLLKNAKTPKERKQEILNLMKRLK